MDNDILTLSYTFRAQLRRESTEETVRTKESAQPSKVKK